MAQQRTFEMPIPQPVSRGRRCYSGVCANRGQTIRRTREYTTTIRQQNDDGEGYHMARVGTCHCGLIVFLDSSRS
jgi:hypothetical protein